MEGLEHKSSDQPLFINLKSSDLRSPEYNIKIRKIKILMSLSLIFRPYSWIFPVFTHALQTSFVYFPIVSQKDNFINCVQQILIWNVDWY